MSYFFPTNHRSFRFQLVASRLLYIINLGWKVICYWRSHIFTMYSDWCCCESVTTLLIYSTLFSPWAGRLVSFKAGKVTLLWAILTIHVFMKEGVMLVTRLWCHSLGNRSQTRNPRPSILRESSNFCPSRLRTKVPELGAHNEIWRRGWPFNLTPPRVKYHKNVYR